MTMTVSATVTTISGPVEISSKTGLQVRVLHIYKNPIIGRTVRYAP
jgi:hypothetical protein